MGATQYWHIAGESLTCIVNMKSKIKLKLEVGRSEPLRGWMFQLSVQNRIVKVLSPTVNIRWLYVHWATRLQMTWQMHYHAVRWCSNIWPWNWSFIICIIKRFCVAQEQWLSFFFPHFCYICCSCYTWI